MAANGDYLEQLVLSGELFNPTSRSSSPTRSVSPVEAEEAEWPPSDAEYEYTSTVGDSGARRPTPPDPEDEEIGMGPGRTGVKGVIRDRAEAARREHERRALDMEALARRMERASLVADAIADGGAHPRGKGKFGHLREVGLHGFLHAIEDEAQSVWVVVHIYEPSLQRCDTLDDTLIRLARQSSDTKFLRCRASALGYATVPRANASSNTKRTKRLQVEDEDDPYGAPDPEDEDDDDDDADVDTDVLPTMHVYRGGQLMYNWVRVDWEAGEAGVGELLAKHGVISSLRSADEEDADGVLTFSGAA